MVQSSVFIAPDVLFYHTYVVHFAKAYKPKSRLFARYNKRLHVLHRVLHRSGLAEEGLVHGRNLLRSTSTTQVVASPQI